MDLTAKHHGKSCYFSENVELLSQCLRLEFTFGFLYSFFVCFLFKIKMIEKRRLD